MNDEYDDISSELIMDKVRRAFKDNSKDWRDSLEEIGFTWVDDGQEEIEEENRAIPENENQEYLIAYFDGSIKYNNIMIDVLIKKAGSEEPNHPLFRKYFKSGNSRLLHLLLSGLSKLPTNKILLSGLGYFHKNRNILSQVITAYIDACKKEIDEGEFKDLCIDFIDCTHADEYDAGFKLKGIFKNNRKKLKIIEEILKITYDESEIIKF